MGEKLLLASLRIAALLTAGLSMAACCPMPGAPARPSSLRAATLASAAWLAPPGWLPAYSSLSPESLHRYLQAQGQEFNASGERCDCLEPEPAAVVPLTAVCGPVHPARQRAWKK